MWQSLQFHLIPSLGTWVLWRHKLYRKCDQLKSKCLDFHGEHGATATDLGYLGFTLLVLLNAPWLSHSCFPVVHDAPFSLQPHLLFHSTEGFAEIMYKAGDWSAEPTKWWICRANEDITCPKEEFWGRITVLSITENRCSLQSLGGKLIWLLLAKFRWWLVNKMQCPRDCETKPSGNMSKE